MDNANERLIDAKQKMASKGVAAGRGIGNATGRERLPSGQHLVDSVKDFPVLDLGIQPDVPLDQWQLDIEGECLNPMTFSFKQLEKTGIVDLVTDFHCVTTWSTYDMPWRGVLMKSVIELARPAKNATHVMFHCYDGYTTNVPLEDCLRPDCMIVTHWNNKPLERKHGGPVRGMIPHLYAWKSAKWLKGIEFMKEDRRGFWEVRGYHNYGDPWREQRYSTQE